MSSFEKQSQAKSLAMLEILDNSLAAEPWALLVDTGAATSVAPKSFAPHLELSPAPSTFQLATATGEAIKIFGLRHVHLQCQDLSFKVSFVIADVVTPILGLDTLMQHNLSLSFEHDQRFLVDKTGKRTQLEHMGRRLYLVACPLQHGLSTCFRGSLSDVIGFLPEDKEIHEQETALTLILLKTEAFQNLCVFMISLALFVCFVMKRLQFQGESFQPLAFIPVSNPSNLRAKMSSFTTRIPDLPCIDLRSSKKHEAKSLYMHCRQHVCLIFLILHGQTQLACYKVTFHRASFQPRILARE